MELNEYEIQLIEVRKVLTEYKTKFEELIKTKIQEKDKIASGNLLASISTKIEVDGSVYHKDSYKGDREAIIQLALGLDWKIIHIPAEYIAKDIQKVEQIIKELSKALV